MATTTTASSSSSSSPAAAQTDVTAAAAAAAVASLVQVGILGQSITTPLLSLPRIQATTTTKKQQNVVVHETKNNIGHDSNDSSSSSKVINISNKKTRKMNHNKKQKSTTTESLLLQQQPKQQQSQQQPQPLPVVVTTIPDTTATTTICVGSKRKRKLNSKYYNDYETTTMTTMTSTTIAATNPQHHSIRCSSSTNGPLSSSLPSTMNVVVESTTKPQHQHQQQKGSSYNNNTIIKTRGTNKNTNLSSSTSSTTSPNNDNKNGNHVSSIHQYNKKKEIDFYSSLLKKKQVYQDTNNNNNNNNVAARATATVVSTVAESSSSFSTTTTTKPSSLLSSSSSRTVLSLSKILTQKSNNNNNDVTTNGTLSPVMKEDNCTMKIEEKLERKKGGWNTTDNNKKYDNHDNSFLKKNEMNSIRSPSNSSNNTIDNLERTTQTSTTRKQVKQKNNRVKRVSLPETTTDTDTNVLSTATGSVYSNATTTTTSGIITATPSVPSRITHKPLLVYCSKHKGGGGEEIILDDSGVPRVSSSSSSSSVQQHNNNSFISADKSRNQSMMRIHSYDTNFNERLWYVSPPQPPTTTPTNTTTTLSFHNYQHDTTTTIVVQKGDEEDHHLHHSNSIPVLPPKEEEETSIITTRHVKESSSSEDIISQEKGISSSSSIFGGFKEVVVVQKRKDYKKKQQRNNGSSSSSINQNSKKLDTSPTKNLTTSTTTVQKSPVTTATPLPTTTTTTTKLVSNISNGTAEMLIQQQFNENKIDTERSQILYTDAKTASAPDQPTNSPVNLLVASSIQQQSPPCCKEENNCTKEEKEDDGTSSSVVVQQLPKNVTNESSNNNNDNNNNDNNIKRSQRVRKPVVNNFTMETLTLAHRVRCKKCVACLRKECGTCYACSEKKQFGGHGKTRAARDPCAYRRCHEIHPPEPGKPDNIIYCNPRINSRSTFVGIENETNHNNNNNGNERNTLNNTNQHLNLSLCPTNSGKSKGESKRDQILIDNSNSKKRRRSTASKVDTGTKLEDNENKNGVSTNLETKKKPTIRISIVKKQEEAPSSSTHNGARDTNVRCKGLGSNSTAEDLRIKGSISASSVAIDTADDKDCSNQNNPKICTFGEMFQSTLQNVGVRNRNVLSNFSKHPYTIITPYMNKLTKVEKDTLPLPQNDKMYGITIPPDPNKTGVCAACLGLCDAADNDEEDSDEENNNENTNVITIQNNTKAKNNSEKSSNVKSLPVSKARTKNACKISVDQSSDDDCQTVSSTSDATKSESNSSTIILCDGYNCGREYHLGCCTPPLTDVPTTKYWFCQDCSVDNTTQSLMQYLETADEAKIEFYNDLLNQSDESEMEQTDWNPVSYVYHLLNRDCSNLDLADDCRIPVSELERSALTHQVALRSPMDRRSHDDSLLKHSLPTSSFVGKPIRIYNSLCNDYHTGRIVDYRDRRCPYTGKVLDGITWYQNAEFLVRFSAGKDHRKQPYYHWLVLEEHSLAVGMSFVWAKVMQENFTKSWLPAILWYRTSRELLPVQEMLDAAKGEIYFRTRKEYIEPSSCCIGTVTKTVAHSPKDKKKVKPMNWALVRTFGMEIYALLDVRQDTTDLTNLECIRKYKTNENRLEYEMAETERFEQDKVRHWHGIGTCKKGMHPAALSSRDWYSLPELIPMSNNNFVPHLVSSSSSSSSSNSKHAMLCPNIRHGVDRLLILRLLESSKNNKNKTNSSSTKDQTTCSIMNKEVASMMLCDIIRPLTTCQQQQNVV